MAFLSLLDDRVKPKGSRDPLGFELIWSKLGRKIIGNLTTITSSSENFATALLGFSLANEIVGNDLIKDRSKAVKDVFLRFEQIAAYMRKHKKSKSVMGVNRVSKRLEDNGITEIQLGNSAGAQILSNQSSYGLWGLYSTAMRDTGLVAGEARILTDSGRILVNMIEAKIDKSSFIKLIEAKEISKANINKYADSIYCAINNDAVQKKLLEALLEGSSGEKENLQKELWGNTLALISTKNKSTDNNKRGSVAAFINQLASTDNLSTQLQTALQNIQSVERLLVTMNNIFHFCRMNNGKTIESVALLIEQQGYNFDSLDENIEGVQIPHKTITLQPIKQLKNKDIKGAIRSILALNKEIMKKRGGAAWITEEKGVLDVVVKSESASLLTDEKLHTIWHYDYFFRSYLSIAKKYATNHYNKEG
ncbi:MAG: hypothetical protein HRU38_08540 [Saccharospirillaceae bacterium]|nr:hypothetical protein [Pseudomonadales bacterium]NRB78701.1 hypothetical protein [Saccharospirillaceae bacterium]